MATIVAVHGSLLVVATSSAIRTRSWFGVIYRIKLFDTDMSQSCDGMSYNSSGSGKVLRATWR